MNLPKIAIIGAGNMGSSLIGGLIKNGHPADQIFASDPCEEKLTQLRNDVGIQTNVDNKAAILDADVIIFAVKPQLMAQTVKPLAKDIAYHQPLVISIAAGVPISSINKWTGGDTAIVRCMPNTPALLGVGATALFANSKVTAQQRDIAQAMLSAVGTAIWVSKENQIDTVTAVSGSGPAYFFMVMEALEEAGIELGLSADVANQLVTQTALGAATMAIKNNMSLKELREQVTSKGGTTEKALNVLEENNLRQMFKNAVLAAKLRSEELAKLYGDE